MSQGPTEFGPFDLSDSFYLGNVEKLPTIGSPSSKLTLKSVNVENNFVTEIGARFRLVLLDLSGPSLQAGQTRLAWGP